MRSRIDYHLKSPHYALALYAKSKKVADEISAKGDVTVFSFESESSLLSWLEHGNSLGGVNITVTSLTTRSLLKLDLKHHRKTVLQYSKSKDCVCLVIVTKGIHSVTTFPITAGGQNAKAAQEALPNH